MLSTDLPFRFSTGRDSTSGGELTGNSSEDGLDGPSLGDVSCPSERISVRFKSPQLYATIIMKRQRRDEERTVPSRHACTDRFC